ncbi:hypothetical protein BGLY_0652 [Bacillus glycinifermentans]|nr:hypothetical protein BGLY_0652 [Bacillus glycinifermentans]
MDVTHFIQKENPLRNQGVPAVGLYIIPPIEQPLLRTYIPISCITFTSNTKFTPL